MRLMIPPGVFRPISDTWLLSDALERERLLPAARVLDLCAGSGALAVAAALGGARDVTAVDVSRRAAATIRVNAALNRVRVRVCRGDLYGAVRGERFDAIVSNPPYVPAASDDLPARGLARAWDAGGMRADVAARESGPPGPLMRARRASGLIPPVAEEDVVVVRGRKARTIDCRSARLNVTM